VQFITPFGDDTTQNHSPMRQLCIHPNIDRYLNEGSPNQPGQLEGKIIEEHLRTICNGHLIEGLEEMEEAAMFRDPIEPDPETLKRYAKVHQLLKDLRKLKDALIMEGVRTTLSISG
jgi:hypothetical protein